MMMFRSKIKSGLRVTPIIVLALLCACVKYIEVKDDREWGNEVFLPSKEGMIVAEGRAKSIDSLLCEEKARVGAQDKMQYLVKKTFSSFISELKRDTSFRVEQNKMLSFVYSAEFIAMDKVMLLNMKKWAQYWSDKLPERWQDSSYAIQKKDN